MKIFRLSCLMALVATAWVAASSATTTAFTETKEYRFKYQVEMPPSTEPEKLFSLWVPYPIENSVQKILSFNTNSPIDWRITQEDKFGNKMIYLQGKLNSKPLAINFTYEIERKPYLGLTKKETAKAKFSDPILFMDPLPKLAGYQQILTIGNNLAKDLKSPSQKIDRFYHYVVNTMSYDKSGTGWGRGDPVWACTNKRGNCTDFHSLFVALSRSQNVPARFEIGVPIPQDKQSGSIPGYHCWAEAFDEASGWKPLDASEAKKTGEIKNYFGMLPSNRIQFSQGRNITLNPPQKAGPLNYFVYPYGELNGKPLAGITQKFSFETL